MEDLDHKKRVEEPSKEAGFIINVDPSTDPEVVEILGKRAHSIILVANAQGTLPGTLHGAIKSLTASGIPVFVIPDNPGENHGVVDRENLYERDLACGAIFLQNVNVNDVDVHGQLTLTAAIQSAVDAGMRGGELGKFISTKFSYAQGEELPTPSMGSEELFNAYQLKLKRELKALGRHK